MNEPYRLLGSRGCGSIIVEAALRLASIPYEREEVDYDQPGPARHRLFALNPLGQVPTLILPDRRIMTESAAIILMLNDLAPEAGLVPPTDASERTPFVRWLIFFVAALYPTWTYGDDPRKWVPGAADPMELRNSTDAHRQKLWRYLETQIEPEPWFLGKRFSALDIYVGAMTHWRPGPEWFRAECPKLLSIAAEVERLPAVAPLFKEQFD
jgi:GST-like protein